MRWWYIPCLMLLSVIPLSSAYAVQVFLDGGEGTYNSKDTFYIPIRIDTQGECINAVRVVVGYNPEILSVKDVSIADSILSLWTENPVIERVEGMEVGRVTFEGGVPGGYCGRVMGDPGLTNILARLVITGSSAVMFSEGSVRTQIIIERETVSYLHDGGGSLADMSVLGTELVLQESTTTPRDIWLSDIRSDTIAPELFEIYLVEGPSPGNARHYIVFNAIDKQSGIDHYEVLETDPDRFGFLSWLPKESYWVQAESPYVLRDQKLHSKILVKAVDKSGNERVVTYTPAMTPLEEFALSFAPIAIIIVILLLFIFMVYLLRRRRSMETKMKHAEHDYEQNHE